MVWIDRNGDNLLHASLAGCGKDLIQRLTIRYEDDAQSERYTLLLLRSFLGVRIGKSE